MRRMQGFTLLEVIVAISLLGLLLVLVASSFTSANRALRSSAQYAERLDEVRASQRFLHQALQATRPLALTAQGGWERLFEGDEQRMRFFAPLPLGIGGSLKLHQLESVQGSDGLWQLRVKFFELDGERPWGAEQVLMSRLQQVQFSYRGLDEERRLTGWLAQWPWPERLPQRIRIQGEAEGPVVWPLMSVVIRTGQQVGALAR